MPSTVFRAAFSAIVVLGIALHIYIAVYESAGGFNSFSGGLLVWSSLPYVAAVIVAIASKKALVGAVASGLVLLVDAWTYHSVFIQPSSSTASLALLWMPLWNLILVVPIGAGVTWAWLRTRSAGNHAP